ncbi:malate synthase G [Alkalicoccus daliensis]|uniref:Malate synthase G n=1 Tax=Alkalicoccus daliensis TaxID=745820 RepID=A0A1H0L010_9BACI|nr:malate synthase G [Alkalicoccus daliensis]SDO61330.1 malate synthase [Alkalicoccus daliensis]
MEGFTSISSLFMKNELKQFLEKEVLPGTGVEPAALWEGIDEIVRELQPEIKQLLHKREELQQQLDQWHSEHPGVPSLSTYREFLKEIGYLEPEVEDFTVGTEKVDTEITAQAGPQLVVPLNNARYVINAANARWGSLYDALYGTDVLSPVEKGSAYNPERGEKVIAYAKQFLDETFPLESGSHQDVTEYLVRNNTLTAVLVQGEETVLQKEQFAGWQGEENAPKALLLKNNEMHAEVQIDRGHPIGKTDQAGVKDILVESATTTIVDAEDSVAAVDTEDKLEVYRNWLGLIKGDLTASFNKGGKEVRRSLAEDREYAAPSGEMLTLSGRSLLLIRNVGHLMTTEMLQTAAGEEVSEGIVDSVVTSLIAVHDVRKNGRYQNSKTGSIYIVKPKMHGSQEVALTNKLMQKIETLYQLPANTIKVGVMDEERRTSLNLKQCIKEVKDRIFFINTGFLDRTGDEIHTSFLGGPMIRKNEMKESSWLQSYEVSNVWTGLNTRLHEKGQIGKGMWPMPEEMKQMMEQKSGQISAGGNTAWVPSPTAASLHALHYHQLDARDIQRVKLTETAPENKMLEVPIEETPKWSKEEIQQELENNAQGILGYVVRWVEQGIGCSKVPNIDDIELMEDRATLRISSQHMANWLQHGIVKEAELKAVMKKMAKLVDQQNEGDPAYTPMTPDTESSIAFQAALELVLAGKNQPSGYTEPILHRRRKEFKAAQRTGEMVN